MINKSIKSIIIKNEYILSSIDKKIIRILIKNINKSKTVTTVTGAPVTRQ